MAVKKRMKLKKGIFQILFWTISILFILIVIIFFIIKFIIGNSKMNNELKINEYIVNNLSVKDGLHSNSGNYVFKGKNVNNYVKYGNLLYRIIRIYKDGSMDIMVDNSVNSLYYGNKIKYIESDVHKYINDVFLDAVSIKDLNYTPICAHEVNKVENVSCDDIDFSSYVRLPSVIDYLDSVEDNETFFDEGTLLSNYSSSFVWLYKDRLVNVDTEKSFSLYPVITLNNRIVYTSGDGTKENPFIIKNKSYYGAYVLIGNDRYVVIDDDGGKIKLMLSTEGFLVRRSYNSNILDYLNDKYYNSLTYKNILQKFNISYGKYSNDYKKSLSKKKKVYIGIPSVNDMKFDNSVTDYYLINEAINNDEVYYYNNRLNVIDKSISMKLRPVIMIKKSKISTGNGSILDPYVVEV